MNVLTISVCLVDSSPPCLFSFSAVAEVLQRTLVVIGGSTGQLVTEISPTKPPPGLCTITFSGIRVACEQAKCKTYDIL